MELFKNNMTTMIIAITASTLVLGGGGYYIWKHRKQNAKMLEDDNNKINEFGLNKEELRELSQVFKDFSPLSNTEDTILNTLKEKFPNNKKIMSSIIFFLEKHKDGYPINNFMILLCKKIFQNKDLNLFNSDAQKIIINYNKLELDQKFENNVDYRDLIAQAIHTIHLIVN